MPSGSQSPYLVLGIGQAGTASDVRQAYQRALRAKDHPRADVTHAFNQLRNAQTRLGHDLLEPEPVGAGDGLDAVLAQARSEPFIDGSSAPLPAWNSLVVLPPVGSPMRGADVSPPTGEYDAGHLLDSPGSEVIPPFEFPV